MTGEIITLLIGVGALGVWMLIREFGKCAEESAQPTTESADEATRQEDWSKQ